MGYRPPMISIAQRRRMRPYKLGIVIGMTATICAYGFWKRLSSAASYVDTQVDDRRLGELKTIGLDQETSDPGIAEESISVEVPTPAPAEPTPAPTAAEAEDGNMTEISVIGDIDRTGIKELEKLEDEGVSTTVVLLNAIVLLYMFLGLAIVCDEFFVPALDMIAHKLQLSPDVAGATFMAAGGSAPEFFTSMVGALSPVPSDVGIVAIVGSAVFNVLFVIGMCGICSPTTLQLTWYPLARDSLFYLVHLGFLFCFFLDSKIFWHEALILFLWYAVYCFFMSKSESVEDYIKETQEQQKFRRLDLDHDGTISREEARGDSELNRQFDNLDTDGDGLINYREYKSGRLRALRHLPSAEQSAEDVEIEPVSLAPPTGCEGQLSKWVYYIVSLPILLVLVGTCPDCRKQGFCQKLYPITFLMSILWIAIMSVIMVHCSEEVGAWTGIDPRILALTLIAGGTSVPDLLTSVLVTLQGHGDMAVSSSIGSNIFDVTVGLPVPWLLYSLINGGKPVSVKSDPQTLAVSVGSLIAMLAFTVISIMLNKWVLNKMLGFVMLVLYVLFTVATIFQIMNE